jgi:hypothetical protein
VLRSSANWVTCLCSGPVLRYTSLGEYDTPAKPYLLLTICTTVPSEGNSVARLVSIARSVC